MDEQSNRTHNHRSKKKKSVTKIVLSIVLGLLVLITAVGGYVVWRVYDDVKSTTEVMYEPVVEQEPHESRLNKPLVVDEGADPFSVLIMGVDTGDFNREYTGRSDTMMLVTVNPNTEKTSIVSIPRDTYTEIVGRNEKDKINHAYAFGGTSMAVNTVQNLFDIPVDYYISVNMEGMQTIIDAIGGITIIPLLTFSHSGNSFVEGEETQLSGAEALSYSRMRYEDPEGDYGRQHRQRQVIEATMQKIATLDSVRNYSSILESMSSSMKTNMSFDDMVDMFNKYRGAVDNVEQIQLSGSGTMIDGVYYEIIPEEEITRVQEYLQKELEL
ncbi:transcriptional attenuator, LytR family [Alkalibacterium putridalgicola]|uniref:Transcriptional attenuator, LytR family n=1 Tax=Alkalibacterium putridalgicola TaxID=426703 RepID=A0A1H7QNK3_9LACT|nr:LCP family protein [Alkalibacterium putridalgicola]GEK88401.1 transcriptional regulator LytR [Alkalibacterium putridalgicola]SEL49338.1 transcriptional attenuator, LytR family [Alkalibacterium putridalgicola]